MKKQNKTKNFDEIKIRPKTLIVSSVIILIAAFLFSIFLAYGTKTSAGIKIKGVVSKFIPIPAAIIDYRYFVLSSDLEKNLSSVQKFYATQDLSKTGLRVDFSTEDGKKRLAIKRKELLQKMIEDKAIEILASRVGIKISSSQADQTIDQKLQELGTASQVKQNLLDSYGWTISDFKRQVVLPEMYKEALVSYFNEHEANVSRAKETIEKAKNELASGKDFAQVATMYSNGPSKEKGGELGWVKKGQLLPELQTVLFGKDKFENDTIIESSIGFHIVEVENKKKEGGEDVLQLRQIFVAKNSFADWLANKMSAMNVILTQPEFIWNKTDGLVEFKDNSMNEFEKQSREKAQGDASIIF